MLIDWFTIVAQIINFLILLFLLRRFLYRPILNAMEAREQRVAALLEEAEQKRRSAEQERERFEAKNRDWEETYEQRKREVESSLDDWRKNALHDARKEVDTTLKNWFRTIENDKEDFFRNLNQFAVRQTYSVASQAAKDLAGADLEVVMVNTFLEKLRRQEINLDHLIGDRSAVAGSSMKLRSAFPLSAELQERLRDQLQRQFQEPVQLNYETEPNLIAGIEIVWENGYAAAWNLRRYLETLEDELDQQMKEQMGERAAAPDQLEV